MKYCHFQTEFGPHYGEVRRRNSQEWIEKLVGPPHEDRPSDGRLTDFLSSAASPRFEPIPLATATLIPPVNPSKIVCVGRNYRDHAAELGNAVPKEPLLFLKPPSSLLGPGKAIRIPSQSRHVDYEGELAIVIGKRASRIGPSEDVKQYIRGYTIVNDVTARDLQKTDGQWTRAKGFDTFCPVGPVVTDEVDPDAGITVETRLNGTLVQQGNTRDLIFSVDFLLRYITAAMTLLPGDLVPTGTPSGVGPMQPGDVVEVTIPGIGSLTNLVSA